MKSDLVDLLMQVHSVTKKAVLVSDDGNRKIAVWLPLSQIEVEKRDHGLAMITMPEWLAIEKGLV